ncbi:MAG: hypothetical protein ABI036_18525 [Fibrobacteria bacterium]
MRKAVFILIAALCAPLSASETVKPFQKPEAVATATLPTATATAAPRQAVSTPAGSQGITVTQDSAKTAPKLSRQDSLAARGKAIQDSLVAHALVLKDSIELRRKFVKDSLAIRAKAIRDSADARNRFVVDSTLARRKAVRDSTSARRKFVRDSTTAHQKAKQDSLAAAQKSAQDAALARRKATRDSLATAHAAALAAMKTKDSVLAAQKSAKRDSVKAASLQAAAQAALAKKSADSAAALRKAARLDSIKTANAAVVATRKSSDSLAAVRKAAKADSLKAAAALAVAARNTKDSLLLAHKAFRRDSLKQAAAMAAAEKKTRDSLAAALKAAKADSTKAAAMLAAAVKRANDSALSAQKTAAADSAKVAASKPQPGKQDSVMARQYRIANRPISSEQIKRFANLFGMKDLAKPETSAIISLYRDKGGALLSYEARRSATSYTNPNVNMLAEKFTVSDSLIKGKTDALLKSILREKAEHYVYANYEVEFFQKKDSGDKGGKIYPPVVAYCTGRYTRKLDERVVLGDAFQIRMTYGEGGAPSSFSLRDPVTTEAEAVKVPTRAHVEDSLARWSKSRSKPRHLLYPYGHDSLVISDLKPLRTFESYMVVDRKFKDPKLDGSYLVPTVTVLAQVKLRASKRRVREIPPPDPIILHFQFPCRPETGLCWPDGKQGMKADVAASALQAAPPKNP